VANLAWENSRVTFREVATWALAKRRLSNEHRNSILMMCTTQILVALLIDCAVREFSFNQSEALPRSGVVHVISMEFLCLLLRRHLARAQVATSRNVGCFLRLWLIVINEAQCFSSSAFPLLWLLTWSMGSIRGFAGFKFSTLSLSLRWSLDCYNYVSICGRMITLNINIWNSYIWTADKDRIRYVDHRSEGFST